MATPGQSSYSRSTPHPTPSSSRFDPIRPARSPKRVKATPSPSSPARPRLPLENAISSSSKQRSRPVKRTESAMAGVSLDRKPRASPSGDQRVERWDWPPRRREMSVPLLSQTLSDFSLSHTSPDFPSPAEPRHPLHRSTPPPTSKSTSGLFSPGPSCFTPRRRPASPPSQTRFGLALARDHVCPSTAPLPHISTFLGSPFSARKAPGGYEYHAMSPSRRFYRGSVTERVDGGFFGSPLEVQEGSEWMVDDLLGPATSDDESLPGVPKPPRRRRDTCASSSSAEDLSGSGTSLASLLSSGRDGHHQPSVITAWDQDDDEERELNSTPSRQLFMAKELSAGKTAPALVDHQIRSSTFISAQPYRPPFSAYASQPHVSRPFPPTRARSSAVDDDDEDAMTDIENACPPARKPTTTDASSPLVRKADTQVGLGLYAGGRRPFHREKTVTIDMARSVSSESSVEIDHSPSRPFSTASTRLSPNVAPAPPLIRRKTDSPDDLVPAVKPQLLTKIRPSLRRGVTEPRVAGIKNAFASPTVHTPTAAAMFGDAKPSPAAFASTGLIKKRSAGAGSELPRFNDSAAASPIKISTHVAPLPMDMICTRSASGSSTSTMASHGARGKGLRRKGSTVFGSAVPSEAGLPVTPTKPPLRPLPVGLGVSTPSPTASSTISYPFAVASSAATSTSPARDPAESPTIKSTLPARVRQLSSRHGPIARASNPMLSAAYRAQTTATPTRTIEETSPTIRGRLDRDFVVVSSLGKGEFSQVWQVKDHQEGRLWAVKAGKPYTGAKNRLRHLEEVSILRQLSLNPHSNVITYIDSWEHSSRLYIRTELLPCGDLSRFLDALGDNKGLGEARVWKTLFELSSGLAHIHANHFLHLDLKPSNVLITSNGNLKIADFGMSSVSSATGYMIPLSPALPDLAPGGNGGFVWPDTDQAVSVIPESAMAVDREFEGDREYLCPEALADGPVCRAADVYSLGILLLEAALNVVLPSYGEGWVKLRSDDFTDINEHYRFRAVPGQTPAPEVSMDCAPHLVKTEEGAGPAEGEEEQVLPLLTECLMGTIKGMMRSDPKTRMTLEEVRELRVMVRLGAEGEQGGARAALVEEGDEDAWIQNYMRE